MSKSKWYTVWVGTEPGVYETWAECKEQIEGYKGAKYKAFPSQSEAMRAYEDGYEAYMRHNEVPASSSAIQAKASSDQVQAPMPILNSLSVDAACSGNPGTMEYRGVLVDSRREVFRIGPFPKGTNNIGEFLAIVHGLSLLKKYGYKMPIYTDSVTGMAWVRNKKCKTLLPRDAETEPLLQIVARAEAWLRENSYETQILKWDTSRWGEIPADFGRKG